MVGWLSVYLYVYDYMDDWVENIKRLAQMGVLYKSKQRLASYEDEMELATVDDVQRAFKDQIRTMSFWVKPPDWEYRQYSSFGQCYRDIKEEYELSDTEEENWSNFLEERESV